MGPAGLVGVFVLGAALITAACGFGAKETPSATGPNILIVVTDDQPANTMQVMPQTRRWFADGGTAFRNAFVTTPLCCPSRASIFTGRYAHNHGVVANVRPGRLEEDETIQRYLHDAGYTTAIVGKFLNSWPVNNRKLKDPLYFDTWAIFNKRYDNALFNIDGELTNIEGNSTSFIAGQAEAVLGEFETDDSQPWFLYVAPHAPHAPFVVERRYARTRLPRWRRDPSVGERDVTDKPGFLQTRQSTGLARRTEKADGGGAKSFGDETFSRFSDRSALLRKAAAVRDGQLRMLMSVDDMNARLAAALERLEEDENTLVFYLSDNGYLWGEHGVIGKRLPYMPSVRVPFYMRWPGHLPPAAKQHGIVANIDIAPTIMEAAGLSTPAAEPMDGRSLLQRWKRPTLLIEQWGNRQAGLPDWASIVTKRHHYVEYYPAQGAPGPRLPDGSVEPASPPGTGAEHSAFFHELYDLESDPYEQRNLLHGRAAGTKGARQVLENLRNALARLRTCRGASCY